MNVILYTALAFLPGAVFVAAARALERWSRGERRWRGVTGAGATPVGPPIERLVADLRRLGRDYSRIAESDLPRRALRLQSVTLAYDDTLCLCCTALEIPAPGRPPFDPVQRLEIEATRSGSALLSWQRVPSGKKYHVWRAEVERFLETHDAAFKSAAPTPTH